MEVRDGSGQLRERRVDFILYMADLMIPLTVFCIVCYGCLMKVRVYDAFVKGAKSGFFTVVRIIPTILGLMIGVGMLRASGILACVGGYIGRLTEKIGIPGEIVPLSIVKMFSSSAANGLLVDLYKAHGTDSLIGLAASISMSCTETIFYTMSVYFVSAKITKTRYTLQGALVATGAGIGASLVLAGFMSGRI